MSVYASDICTGSLDAIRSMITYGVSYNVWVDRIRTSIIEFDRKEEKKLQSETDSSLARAVWVDSDVAN